MLVKEKQKRFCEEYLVDCNATQAAIRAGYSEKTARAIGQRLLTNVDIKKYIDQQLQKLKNEKIADAQEVLEYLTSVMRGEQKEQVALLTGEGVQDLVQKDVSAKDRLKSAELIGKRYALFTEKLELQGETTVQIVDDIPMQEGDTV
jgi:phage terminase small subunit